MKLVADQRLYEARGVAFLDDGQDHLHRHGQAGSLLLGKIAKAASNTRREIRPGELRAKADVLDQGSNHELRASAGAHPASHACGLPWGLFAVPILPATSCPESR